MSTNPNAIEKTLLIMKAFTEEPFEYTAKELSDKLKISKPTVHRILNILEKDKFVKRTLDMTKYTVGYASYIVGMQYAKRQDVYSEVRRVVDKVAKSTGQQVGYTVMEGENVISIYESEFFNRRINYMPGEIYTVNCGVYGKVLMSYSHSIKELEKLVYEIELKQVTPNAIMEPEKLLEEYKKVRINGYAESDGEHIEGTLGIGAPTFYSNGKIHGCIGLSGIKSETFKLNKPNYIKEVLKGAEEISRLLI
ncbi:IclR family transcriptional regulator [Wukongibacter baidiensis]|uniref:IclR family transcriptional regulator n=1 Tax=Wukongibacter baidiensis TaxID=1723361 RepID=UPI003D7F7FFB